MSAPLQLTPELQQQGLNAYIEKISADRNRASNEAAEAVANLAIAHAKIGQLQVHIKELEEQLARNRDE